MFGQSRSLEATLVAFTLIALVCGCVSCGSHKASPRVLRVDRDGTPLPPHALLRLGTLRHRIPEGCWAIDISPDGKWVVTGSMPGSLRNDVEVWDRESGTRLATLVTETTNIVDIAWSPTGDRIWVAHDSGIEAFRPNGGSLGRIAREYPAGVDGYYELCATKDGQRVAAYHPMRGLVQVWDRDLRPIWKRNVFFDIESLAMSGDGLLIAFGGDGCLQVQSPDDADPGVLEIDVPGKVTSLDFSPDRSRVAAAVMMLNDKELRERKSRILVWNPDTGELVGQSEEFPGEGTEASYSADGPSIITGNWIDTIHVWDARTTELRRRIVDANRIGRSTAIASEQPIAVSADRAIGAWNYSNGSELLSRDAGHVNWVNSVEFVDGGHRIASACPDGLRVWDANTGEQLATPVGAEDGAWGLATSANGRFLAFARRGGDVAILDRQSNAPARVLYIACKSSTLPHGKPSGLSNELRISRIRSTLRRMGAQSR